MIDTKIFKNLLRNHKRFNDRVDVNFTISLYEYGIIRNPKNDVTWLGTEIDDNGNYKNFDNTWISFDDVLDVLQNNMEVGFFEYIGQNKTDVIKNLDNNNLAGIIHSINSYNGWFNSDL